MTRLTIPHSHVKEIFATDAKGNRTMFTNDYTGPAQLLKFAMQENVFIVDSDNKIIKVKGK